MRKNILLVTLAILLAVAVASLLYPFRREVRIVGQTAIAHLYSTPAEPFPAIDTTHLNAIQRRIVTLSRQEYAKKPISYDTTVLKYTQGVSEPWCADFVSWIFRQAGQSFANPNSGSWRIPGVYTLQAYFQAQHGYMPAGKYIPETGDVAIYHSGEGHTNIVLSVHNGRIITIGGNETGHLRIESQPYTKDADGLDGFGVFRD